VSRQIVITLDEHEYARLERAAAARHRSMRNLAAYLVMVGTRERCKCSICRPGDQGTARVAREAERALARSTG